MIALGVEEGLVEDLATGFARPVRRVEIGGIMVEIRGGRGEIEGYGPARGGSLGPVPEAVSRLYAAERQFAPRAPTSPSATPIMETENSAGEGVAMNPDPQAASEIDALSA